MTNRSILVLAILLTFATSSSADSNPFRIQVVDDETGRGVPLVELQTVNNIRLFTDSNGIVAFDESGLMDQSLFFYIKSHGYEFAKDGFGYRGKAVDVRAGGRATLKIKRRNLAQRLYRITGAGIYRDSILTGEKPPIKEPLLNGLVLGSDSVVNAAYRGKIYWFWGDTNRPGYPLGNFHVPGATSEFPEKGGLDPGRGIDLDYFVDDKGFARPTAQMPGEGPTWIDGLVVLREESGRERMFAAYVKVKPPLDVYRHGLAEFDDETGRFKKVVEFDHEAPAYPGGHPFVMREGDVDYVYFCRPYPLVRVRAIPKSLEKLDKYEAYTCLKPGSRLAAREIDRGPNGEIHYGWKRNTPAVGPNEEARLIAGKHLRRDEVHLQLCDRDSGKTVNAHNGSVYWNDFRRRWVMIAVEQGGTSLLGEVWYAEADSPLGPWAYAVKIVTHDRYSFYNPKQHPLFDQRAGRTIFFEGTYTHTFSGNTDQTPRYDYNQIMYKLELDDPRVAIPVAIYQPSETIPNRFAARAATKPKEAMAAPDLARIAFFALDQPGVDTFSVSQSKTSTGHFSLTAEFAPRTDSAKAQFQFFALAANTKNPPAATVPLYEYIERGSRRRAYSTDKSLDLAGFERQEPPLCRVWRNPWRSDRHSPP